MSNEIDRNIRLRAMWCHLSIAIGSLPLAYILSTGSNIDRIERNLSAFYEGVFFLPLIGYILSIVLTNYVWRINRHRHQFIDVSAKEAINCAISIFLYLLTIDVITIFSIYFLGYIDAPENMINLALIGTILNLLLLFFALLIVCFAIVKVFKGSMYSYPLIIRFLQ
jgi:uncharacterized Tic20 family protein